MEEYGVRVNCQQRPLTISYSCAHPAMKNISALLFESVWRSRMHKRRPARKKIAQRFNAG